MVFTEESESPVDCLHPERLCAPHAGAAKPQFQRWNNCLGESKRCGVRLAPSAKVSDRTAASRRERELKTFAVSRVGQASLDVSRRKVWKVVQNLRACHVRGYSEYGFSALWRLCMVTQ